MPPPKEMKATKAMEERKKVRFRGCRQNYRREKGVPAKLRATCQQNRRYSAEDGTAFAIAARVLSRSIQRSTHVLRQIVLFIGLAPLALSAQAPDGVLTAHLKAIGNAANDVERDSASAVVKRELGAVLSSDSAFSAKFTGVPITRVEAPDGTFRLFTWNVRNDDGSFRYEGFLLVKDHRKHTLYELRDMTDHIDKPATAQLSPENWYGALYYEVVPVKQGGKTRYTLLGWKGASTVETRKVIEVLNVDGRTPKFGAALFNDGRKRSLRMIYGYTAQGSMQLKWMPGRKAIVADHLSPTRPEFAGQPAFMAPDLSFDSWTWDKNHWQYTRDIDLRGTESKPYNTPPKEAR